MVHVMLQPVQEVLHHPGRDTGLLGRVDKAKEDEIMQEHPPVGSEALEQPIPIKLGMTRVQQVQNVCPVIPFTFHDIALGPEHFFWWAEAHGNSQGITSHGMAKPCRINRGKAVTRAKDHVDTIRAAACLAEPMRKGQLRVISCGVEDLERMGTMMRVDKEIKVFGMANGSCWIPGSWICRWRTTRLLSFSRSLSPYFSIALKMHCDSWTTLEHKTPESNKSVP